MMKNETFWIRPIVRNDMDKSYYKLLGQLTKIDPETMNLEQTNDFFRNLGQNQGAQNIGFAIPIAMARDVMQQIVESGSVRRGSLGAIFSDLPLSLLNDGSAVRRGVQVREVTPGGPAWSAGIRPGDVLMTLDGEDLSDARALLLTISQRQPGGRVEFSVQRGAEVFETYATLIQQPPLR